MLHEKHVVATWHLGYHLSICSWTEGNQEKPVSRWPVAGLSGPCPPDSSPATNVIIMSQQGPHTHNTSTLKMTTIHTITTMHMEKFQECTWKINSNYPQDSLRLLTLHARRIWIPRRRIWTPRDEFEYHERNLNTTRRIWKPWDGFEYHETDFSHIICRNILRTIQEKFEFLFASFPLQYSVVLSFVASKDAPTSDDPQTAAGMQIVIGVNT